jgi:hypothetical protein
MTMGQHMPTTNTSPQSEAPLRPPDATQRHATQAIGLGSSVESLAGLGAITLAILGLAGVLPFVFAAIATIVVGAALLLEGIAIAGAFAEEVRHSQAFATKDESMVGGGVSAQTLGGAAGITLGILALVGIAPWTLLSVSVIVFGGTLLLSGPTRIELLNQHAITAGMPAPSGTALAVKSSSAAMSLAGLGAIALGVVAITHTGAMPTLVLIGLLVAGGANLLGGTALVSRAASALR